MSTLSLPTGLKPTNLHLPDSAKHHYIEADLYDICGRLKEIDESLFIVLLEHSPTETHAYAVMETCADGWERLIFKVDELDGRVLDRVRKLMSIPLAERIKKLEAENHKFEQDEHEKSLDDLYERVGAPMWGELERCGFIQRPKSYAKRGVTGGKGSNRAERRAAEKRERRA